MPSWFGINDTDGQYRQSRARSEFRAIQGCDLDVSAGSHQTSGALVALADRRHAADEFRAFPGLCEVDMGMWRQLDGVCTCGMSV